MKQKADLTLAQIQQAWNFAETINEEYDNFERKDFLGAYIHKDQYNQDTEFGWCVEYILDQEFLNQYSTTDADIFCEANVRVLFIRNHLQNINEGVGNFSEYLIAYSLFSKYLLIYFSYFSLGIKLSKPAALRIDTCHSLESPPATIAIFLFIDILLIYYIRRIIFAPFF